MLDEKMLYYKKINVSTHTEGERWKDIDRQTDKQIDRPAIAVETIWALSFNGAHFDNNSVKLDCKPPFIIRNII